MVGELKCEFDVSSLCVTEEWSFTFTHDALKHLYVAGMPRETEIPSGGTESTAS